MNVAITHAIHSSGGVIYYAIPESYEDPILSQIQLTTVNPRFGSEKDWFVVYPVQGSEEDIASLKGKAVEVKLDSSAVDIRQSGCRWFVNLN